MTPTATAAATGAGSRYRTDLLPRLTLALVLLEAVAAVVDAAPLDAVRAGLAGVILVLAVVAARPMWRLLAAGFVVVGVVLVATQRGGGSPAEVYVSGMLAVTPVVALLVVVTRLNAVVRRGGYNVALAAFLTARGGGRWVGRLPLVLAYVLSPVLLAGALAQSYGPFQTGEAEHDRGLLAVAVRAISLGLVWSPMAAPTAFALTLLGVPVLAYLAIALPASLLGLVLLVLGTRSTPVRAGLDLSGQQDGAKVARLVAFLAALPALVGLLAAVTGEVSLHIVLLAMCVVTVVWMLVDRGSSSGPAAPAGGPAKAGLAAEGVALYLSLGVFVGGVRLVTSDGLGWATDPGVVVAVAFLGAAAGFLLGVHPVAVIAVLSPTVLALDPAFASVGAFALCAGAQAVNVSTPFSPLSVVGSQVADSTPWRVSAPVHWRFSLQQLALYGAVCATAVGIASSS